MPSTSEPVVLLFHTEEGAQQFYGDGFDSEGVYWYSGMGATGDMDWNYANRAVKDHAADGRDLYLFERFQRQGGYWLLSHQMHYVEHREEQRKDREGTLRRAIIFGLVPVEESGNESISGDLATLRRLADSTESSAATIASRVQKVYARSAAVKLYALARAKGECEACLAAAPFVAKEGQPYLEVHHLDRLADGGPDRPDRVAGICPNCHRRCHYGADGKQYNDALRSRIAAKEAALVMPGQHLPIAVVLHDA